MSHRIYVKDPDARALCWESTSGIHGLYMIHSGENPVPNLWYSFDKYNWIKWDTITPLQFGVGQKLWIRGKNETISRENAVRSIFYVTNPLPYSVNCSGNIMHLLDWEQDLTAISAPYCFNRLFVDLNREYWLNSLPQFPATRLSPYCYYSMLANLGIQIDNVSLPATIFADYCYYGLFGNNYVATKGPILPAVNLTSYCYQLMFTNCSSLREVTIYAENGVNATNLESWLHNCATTGVVKLKQAAYNAIPKNSISGIPSGWTHAII